MMLDPKPGYYDRILLVRGAGTAKIGGIMGRPNLSMSYLLAARHVIEKADRHLSEIALPAAYLQRHAVEIEMKDLLHTARSISQDDAWFELLQTDEDAEPPPANLSIVTHDLLRLLREAELALAAIGFDPVPAPLAAMCSKLTAVENSDPTRMRHLRSLSGDSQFPKAEVIPIVEHQNELETIFADLVYVDSEPNTPNQNYGTRLAWAGAFAEQPLTYRLYDWVGCSVPDCRGQLVALHLARSFLVARPGIQPRAPAHGPGVYQTPHGFLPQA